MEDLYKSSKKKWNIINLRYFNPIGAHESGLIGEDSSNIPTNIFPLIIQVAAKNISKLNIFGNDCPTDDGTGIRDYIHIMDLADAHCYALDFLLENKPQILSLNIGTGIGTSVLSLVKIFEKVNNVKVPYQFVDRRKGDIASFISDDSLACSLFGWELQKLWRKCV